VCGNSPRHSISLRGPVALVRRTSNRRASRFRCSVARVSIGLNCLKTRSEGSAV
jgi:hypothetical protein